MTDRAAIRIPGARISHIFIAVNDLAAMTTFYRRILGFDIVHEDKGDSVFLALPGQRYPQIALTAAREPRAVPERHWFIVIETDDIASARARIHEDGLSISAVQPVPFGRAAILSDPEGNVIEIHQADGGKGEAG